MWSQMVTTPTSGSNGSSSPSLSNYSEQYKALQNLDFMTAAKIVFSKTAKKKEFGRARSEMRKMDAELERKKQAEFEEHAKEMEHKAAEEKAKVASNPALLEVKERLDKLEQTIKEIVVESKKQLNEATKEGREDSSEKKKVAEVEPDNTKNQSGGKTFSKGIVSNDGKTSRVAPSPHI